MMLFMMLFLSLPKMLLSYFFVLFDFNYALSIFGHTCVWWSSLQFVRSIKVLFRFVNWWFLCIECTQLQWGCSFWELFSFKKLSIYKFVKLHSQNLISLENITNPTFLKVFKCTPTSVRFYVLYEQTHVLAPPSFQSSHQWVNIMFPSNGIHILTNVCHCQSHSSEFNFSSCHFLKSDCNNCSLAKV